MILSICPKGLVKEKHKNRNGIIYDADDEE